MADVKKTTGFGEEKSFRGKLASALWDYGQSDAYPFHMPGHKRNPAFMTLPPVNSIDITEIDGFDDLHHSDGILKEVQERAARVRGAERTWFVVNGSTCGILAAVSACVRPGERILLARNCHKAVYNAIELRGLNPVYLYLSSMRNMESMRAWRHGRFKGFWKFIRILKRWSSHLPPMKGSSPM